ncbi:hypothetical protein B0H11DRAFT_2280651 [Mycena galericulata]|nr:hypothetical protein B0H11DRAFT_2280651 [Mycena galericulata]
MENSSPREPEATISALDLEWATRFLCSNDAPYGPELPTIQHVLVAERDRIERLRTEIAELRLATQSRVKELKEIEETFKNHKKIMSPVRRVPAEILCEIFSWTLPYTRRAGAQTIQQAPWRLGHICKRWRATALQYSPLWSTITLYAARNGGMSQATLSTMVETQLDRSANALLHIIFDCRDGEIVAAYSPKIIDLIMALSPRWESARLRLDRLLGDPLLNRLRSVKGQLPRLRTLEFTSSSAHVSVIGDTFSVAPRLREVILAGAEIPDASLPKIPFVQLTRYHGTCNYDDGHKILASTPNLVEYAMTLGGRQDWQKIYPPVILPHLRRIGAEDGIQFITAPSLQEVWMSGHWFLPGCIQRSSCNLVKFVLQDCSEPAGVVEILRASPTLTTFYVTFADKVVNAKTRPLFDALKLTGGPSDICPRLSHFAAGGPTKFGISALKAVITSRWRTDGPSRLSFARIIYWNVSANQIMIKASIDYLEKLRKEGLDAAVETNFRPSPDNYMGIGRP